MYWVLLRAFEQGGQDVEQRFISGAMAALTRNGALAQS